MHDLAELIDESYTLFSSYEMGGVMAVCIQCYLLSSSTGKFKPAVRRAMAI